jgi:hypothetical protein
MSKEHDYITSDEDDDNQDDVIQIDSTTDASNSSFSKQADHQVNSDNESFIDDSSSNEVFQVDERIKRLNSNESIDWNISEIEKKQEKSISMSMSINEHLNKQNSISSNNNNNNGNEDIICLDDDEVSQNNQIQHDYVSRQDLNEESNNSVIDVGTEEILNVITENLPNSNESNQQIISRSNSKTNDSLATNNSTNKQINRINTTQSLDSSQDNSQKNKSLTNDKKLDQIPTIKLKKLSDELIKSFSKSQSNKF